MLIEFRVIFRAIVCVCRCSRFKINDIETEFSELLFISI